MRRQTPETRYALALGEVLLFANQATTTDGETPSPGSDRDGNLYAGGTGPDTGERYEVNAANSATTFVGTTGFGPATDGFLPQCGGTRLGPRTWSAGNVTMLATGGAEGLWLGTTLFKQGPGDPPKGRTCHVF